MPAAALASLGHDDACAEPDGHDRDRRAARRLRRGDNVRTPPGAAARAGDDEVARGSLLRLADLPAGWTANEASERTGLCDGIEAPKRRVSARANSPTFSRDETTVASGTVYVFPDDRAAAAAFRSLASRPTRQCIAQILKRGLARTSTARFGKPRTTPLAIDSVGDDRAAGRLTIPARSDGIDLRLFVDVVFVRVRRGVQIELFSSALRPFDVPLRSRLTAVTARRLASSVVADAA